MKKIVIFAAVLFLIAFSLNNCKKSSEFQEEIQQNEGNNEAATQTGTFKFYISADSAPAVSSSITQGSHEDVISLMVTLDNLEVHRTSDSYAGWHSLPIPEGTYDLIAMDENSLAELLSSTEIYAGNYNKFRIAVTQAEVTTESGIYEAEVPSEKIKVNVPFIVHDGGTTEITIEIDPQASLKITGNPKNPKYKINPVLKIKNITEEPGDD